MLRITYLSSFHSKPRNTYSVTGQEEMTKVWGVYILSSIQDSFKELLPLILTVF